MVITVIFLILSPIYIYRLYNLILRLNCARRDAGAGLRGNTLKALGVNGESVLIRFKHRVKRVL